MSDLIISNKPSNSGTSWNFLNVEDLVEDITLPKNALSAIGVWSILSTIGASIHRDHNCLAIRPDLEISNAIYLKLTEVGLPSGMIAGTFMASTIASVKLINMVNKGIEASAKALGYKQTIHIPEILGLGIGYVVTQVAEEAFKNVHKCLIVGDKGWLDTASFSVGYACNGLMLVNLVKFTFEHLIIENKPQNIESESKE